MAETAGLVVGTVALAGLFNNTVQCFEYLELGRSLGKDFRTCQLKLDSAQLRLSRWGTSIGLSENRSKESLEAEFGVDPVARATSSLDQIIDLFAAAEKISKKFVAKEGHDTYNPERDLDSASANLHVQLRQLSLKRVEKFGLRQKVKWALYEQKPFRRLIEDVTELTDNLVVDFEAAQKTQQTLCEQEAAVVSTNEAVPALMEIAAEQDKSLEAALMKVMEGSKGTTTTYNVNFAGSQNSGQQIGHSTGNITATFGRGA